MDANANDLRCPACVLVRVLLFHVLSKCVGCGNRSLLSCCCYSTYEEVEYMLYVCMSIVVMVFSCEKNGVWCLCLFRAEDPSSVVAKESFSLKMTSRMWKYVVVWIRYPTLLEKKLLLLCVDIVFVKELLVMVWQTLGL